MTADHLTQTPAGRILEQTLQAGRLPHAVLLTGERLEDLEHLALSLAARLLDTEHPAQAADFFELRPQKRARMINIGSKSERMQGQWPPNSMRRLIADLQLTAGGAGAKVAVVHEADRMNTQTANAFLKTLEEPPPQTTLLLLTTRPYQLLATIRSRCMNLRLPEPLEPLPDADWQQWLTDYRQWLETLTSGRITKESAAQLTLTTYGLISRFEACASRLANERWETEKSEQPEHLDDEARLANETGARKGLRARLWREMEEATHAFVRDSNPEKFGGRLAMAIQSLERHQMLMEALNYQQPASLEAFLLQSLRLWAR